MTFQFPASMMLKIMMYHLSSRNLGGYVTSREWQIIPVHFVFKNTYSFKEKVFSLEETRVLDPAGRLLSIYFLLWDVQEGHSFAGSVRVLCYSVQNTLHDCRTPCMIAEDPAWCSRPLSGSTTPIGTMNFGLGLLELVRYLANSPTCFVKAPITICCSLSTPAK